MAIEAPAFHDIDLVCEIYNETTLQQYHVDLKRWESNIQAKWEKFEIDDEEYESCLRNGTLDEYEQHKQQQQNQFQQGSTLQMCKTLPPVVVNYELDESNIDRSRRLRSNAKKQLNIRPQIPTPELLHLAFTARTLVYNEYLDLCHDTKQIAKFFIDTCLGKSLLGLIRLHLTLAVSGGDYRNNALRKSNKGNELHDLSQEEANVDEQLTVNTDEGDVLRDTLSDLLRNLLSDRVFADTLPEMIAENVPYFSQLQYSQTSSDTVTGHDQQESLTRLTQHEGILSDHDHSLASSSIDQDKYVSHRHLRPLPISSTPSSLYDFEPKPSHEETERLKNNPNLISLTEDIVENTLWNILQEAYQSEFSLTARPRLIALPPKRQSPLLTRANLQQTDANQLPPPLIMTESIE